MADRDSANDDRRDFPLYVVAAVGLLVFGTLLRTPILNWICGPAFVVAVVTLGGAWRDRHL